MISRRRRLGARSRHERPSDAFEAVFRAHFAEVYRYTRVRLGASDGEEVAAACFQAAAERFAEGRGDEVTIGWLMTVARNKVIDHWRRSTTRRERAHLVAVDEPRDDIAELIARSARRDAVLAALDQLSQRHRALLVMSHVDGRSSREIAEMLDLSSVAVDSALSRARTAFRRAYREPEASHGT